MWGSSVEELLSTYGSHQGRQLSHYSIQLHCQAKSWAPTAT